MSLFTSFNSGVSGIVSSQSGLNTTAHNLANTRTTGYSRQQNINMDTYYQNLRVTTKGKQQVGYGTTVSVVRQIRDIYRAYFFVSPDDAAENGSRRAALGAQLLALKEKNDEKQRKRAEKRPD